jgi:hypothetical protein
MVSKLLPQEHLPSAGIGRITPRARSVTSTTPHKSGEKSNVTAAAARAKCQGTTLLQRWRMLGLINEQIRDACEIRDGTKANRHKEPNIASGSVVSAMMFA